ncbi:MAG: metal-dependent hydrolase [Myxococcota bacterium]
MAGHPMDDIPVRRLRFKLDDDGTIEDHDPVWSRSCPEFAMFINSLGIHVPYFERFLVEVMRKYRGEIDDPELAEDVHAIMGQEAFHAFNFVGWNKAMARRYPKITKLDEAAKNYFEKAFEKRGKKFRIGFTAGYETFTVLAGIIILDRYEELMADADPKIRALWVWHQVEEVEHGAVAFDFYKYFYKHDEWYRRWMVVRAFSHILSQTFKGYAHMVRIEGLYRRPLGALRAWRFFLSFGLDLAVTAFPVLSRKYHPRNHPICNEEQNRVAVAWRQHVADGADPLRLTDGDVERMLEGA